MLNKKEELINKFEQRGYISVVIKWIPKNPYGKKHKASGWIYKLYGDLEWNKLGDNFEDAVKGIDSIQESGINTASR